MVKYVVKLMPANLVVRECNTEQAAKESQLRFQRMYPTRRYEVDKVFIDERKQAMKDLQRGKITSSNLKYLVR